MSDSKKDPNGAPKAELKDTTKEGLSKDVIKAKEWAAMLAAGLWQTLPGNEKKKLTEAYDVINMDDRSVDFFKGVYDTLKKEGRSYPSPKELTLGLVELLQIAGVEKNKAREAVINWPVIEGLEHLNHVDSPYRRAVTQLEVEKGNLALRNKLKTDISNITEVYTQQLSNLYDESKKEQNVILAKNTFATKSRAIKEEFLEKINKAICEAHDEIQIPGQKTPSYILLAAHGTGGEQSIIVKHQKTEHYENILGLEDMEELGAGLSEYMEEIGLSVENEEESRPKKEEDPVPHILEEIARVEYINMKSDSEMLKRQGTTFQFPDAMYAIFPAVMEKKAQDAENEEVIEIEETMVMQAPEIIIKYSCAEEDRCDKEENNEDGRDTDATVQRTTRLTVAEFKDEINYLLNEACKKRKKKLRGEAKFNADNILDKMDQYGKLFIELGVRPRGFKDKYMSLQVIPILFEEEFDEQGNVVSATKEGLQLFVYDRAKDEKIEMTGEEVEIYNDLEDLLDGKLRFFKLIERQMKDNLSIRAEKYFIRKELAQHLTGDKDAPRLQERRTTQIKSAVPRLQEKARQFYESIDESVGGRVLYGMRAYDIKIKEFHDRMQELYDENIRDNIENPALKAAYDLIIAYLPQGMLGAENEESKSLHKTTQDAAAVLDDTLRETLDTNSYKTQKSLMERSLSTQDPSEFIDQMTQDRAIQVAMQMLWAIDGNLGTVGNRYKPANEKTALELRADLFDGLVTATALYCDALNKHPDKNDARNEARSIMLEHQWGEEIVDRVIPYSKREKKEETNENKEQNRGG